MANLINLHLLNSFLNLLDFRGVNKSLIKYCVLLYSFARFNWVAYCNSNCNSLFAWIKLISIWHKLSQIHLLVYKSLKSAKQVRGCVQDKWLTKNSKLNFIVQQGF